MARFTTRVELHDSDSDDYETLHDEMKAKGFSRIIKDKNGKRWHLPTAEYNYDGAADIDDVLAKAKAAAKKTGLESEIIVTESNRRRWSNLKPV